jgi:hypothetical protein
MKAAVAKRAEAEAELAEAPTDVAAATAAAAGLAPGAANTHATKELRIGLVGSSDGRSLTRPFRGAPRHGCSP